MQYGAGNHVYDIGLAIVNIPYPCLFCGVCLYTKCHAISHTQLDPSHATAHMSIPRANGHVHTTMGNAPYLYQFPSHVPKLSSFQYASNAMPNGPLGMPCDHVIGYAPQYETVSM